MRFLKIFGIIGIVFAIFFSFVREIKWIIVWSYASNNYLKNKSCKFLYYNTNTAVANYSRILFSGVKLSKEVCVHHIEHEPVLLESENFIFVCLIIKFIKSYICKGLVSILMAQFWVCIRLNVDFIKIILVPPLWKTFSMSTKNISIEKTIVFVVST